MTLILLNFSAQSKNFSLTGNRVLILVLIYRSPAHTSLTSFIIQFSGLFWITLNKWIHLLIFLWFWCTILSNSSCFSSGDLICRVFFFFVDLGGIIPLCKIRSYFSQKSFMSFKAPTENNSVWPSIFFSTASGKWYFLEIRCKRFSIPKIFLEGYSIQ